MIKRIADCPDLYCSTFGRKVDDYGYELCECNPDPCDVSYILISIKTIVLTFCNRLASFCKYLIFTGFSLNQAPWPKMFMS